MSLEPVTGFNTLNNILRLLRVQIPLDAPIVNKIAKMVLVRELNMYFTRIRKEDESLSFDRLDEFSEEVIDQICFRRGIEIDRQTKAEKVQDLKLWLSISNQRNVPHSLLLFTRINDFTNDTFEVSEKDDDVSILRRSNQDTYFLEKMRVFEHTFGIDKLQKRVA
mmetsp:Transcript_22003/g.34160  ORF Transcript_22003/g.34160 Transcript_22003/m.34160 type:complete len:165 (+) Transcript_22003:1177-1671(+)